MDVLEAIKSRRSIKHYDPDFVIPAADEQLLEQAIRCAPTAFNIQNWRILKVNDPEQRRKIRAAAWNQAQVTDASLLYIFCGDKSAWQKNPRRYWETAPQDIQDFMTGAIEAYYKDKPQVQRDEVMRSCGLAAANLMLAAKGLGYDSCPMDGFDFSAVAEIVNLPADYEIVMFVVVGKGIKPAWEKGGYIPHAEVFQENSF